MGARLAWLFVVVSVALVGAASGPTRAHAQTRAQLAESRRLFEQGLGHAQAERWEQAREAFERALAITERPSILLNLATAEAETGALLAAARSYRRFLELATGRDQRQHRAEAAEALAAVEARTPHLELEVSGLATDDEIRLDDRVVPRDELIAPVALDPGEHRVTVRRAGREIIDQRVALREAERRPLTLRAPDLRPARVVESTVEPVAETRPSGGGGDDGLAIGLGVGLGVAAVIAGAVIVGVVLGSETPAPYQGNVGAGVLRF